MKLSESKAERAALAVAAETLATEAGYNADSGVVKDRFNSAVSALLEDGLISDSTAIQIAGDVADPLAGNTRVSVRDVEAGGRLTDNTARPTDDDSGMPSLSANQRAQELADADADRSDDPDATNATSTGMPALSVGERLAETRGGRR